MPSAAALLLAAAAALWSGSIGCTSTQNTSQSGRTPTGWVKDIQLSSTRGQVGAPFESRLSWSDNYIDEPEFSVTGLPRGLRFDERTRSIAGKPSRAGFYTVNVAIRKKVRVSEMPRRPEIDERWWPARFEIEIYAAMK